MSGEAIVMAEALVALTSRPMFNRTSEEFQETKRIRFEKIHRLIADNPEQWAEIKQEYKRINTEQ